MNKFNKPRYIKFFCYLLPYWKKEAFVLFLSAIGFGLGLVGPYLTKLMIDKAYVKRDLRLFVMLVILGALAFVLNSIVSVFINFLNRSIKLGISFTLNRKVFKKLQHLPYLFFQETPSAGYLYKITYDIERTTQLISDILPQLLFLIPKSLFIFGVVFYLDRRIALFSLALLPFLYFVPYYFTRKLKKLIKIWIENSQRIFERAKEVLSHLQLIKTFGKEGCEIKSYITSIIHNTRLNLANTKLELTASFASGLVHRAILGLIIFYAGFEVIKGRLTLGTLSAIILYLSQLSGLQNILAYYLQQIALGLVSCERLEMVLDAPVELQAERQSKEAEFSNGRIEFRNVAFGYRENRIILDDLSFCIEGGSCVGMVGPSGCGKTTTVNLILRLYKPSRGEVLIDGCDINFIKSKIFYEQIGFVPQQPCLWDESIESNIRYGKEDASFLEIQEAAAIACSDAFINSLPDSYKTIIGENGCRLSEGQKQRIAIARAVIKNPKVLILDEAFSSMDLELETRVIANIRHKLKTATIIVISHRLPTINTMDMVYFFASSGKIDTGKHEELLRKNTQYQNYLSHNVR